MPFDGNDDGERGGHHFWVGLIHARLMDFEIQEQSFPRLWPRSPVGIQNPHQISLIAAVADALKIENTLYSMVSDSHMLQYWIRSTQGVIYRMHPTHGIKWMTMILQGDGLARLEWATAGIT